MKYVVYQITFPNNKIYIGKDIGGNGHSLRYFGSWSNELVAQDFTAEECRNFTLTKTILFESSDKEAVNAQEIYFINLRQSNDPAIGYNRTYHKPVSQK